MSAAMTRDEVLRIVREAQGRGERPNLRGANLSGSCLVHADLTGARLGGSVNLHQAIFCQTIMPDGSLNTADCGRGDACCPTPSQGAGAGCSLNDRSCSRNSDCCSNFCNSQGVCRNATENCRRLNELCGAFAGRCCSEEGTVCTGGILSRCSAPCRNDDECRQKFPQYDTGDQFMVCQPGGPCGDSACCARVCPFQPELCLY